MKKALFVLQHLKRFHEKYKEDELSEFTIDCDDYERIDEAIADLEALQSRSCDNCLHNSRPKYKEPCSNCMWVNEFDNWEAKQ